MKAALMQKTALLVIFFALMWSFELFSAEIAVPTKSTAYTTDVNLLTPDMDQGLWGLGSIPSISHAGQMYSKRRKNDDCKRKWAKFQALGENINATQIPVSLKVLKDSARKFGIAGKMVEKTLAVFLRNQSSLPNQRFVTIFDHTQPSTAKRFVILDLWKGTAAGYRVAHGKGSDPGQKGKAVRFGNTGSRTYKSSVGCAIANDIHREKRTRQEPKGRFAVTMFGFEDSNDRICDRGMYMHAAPYMSAAKPGRSWGCPAFNYQDRDEVFKKVDGGGLVCAFGE